MVCHLYSLSGMRYSRGPMSVAEEVEGRENDEKRLLRHLMRGYERDVRPVKNASTPVVIQLSITLTQIFDMVRLYIYSRFFYIICALFYICVLYAFNLKP